MARALLLLWLLAILATGARAETLVIAGLGGQPPFATAGGDGLQGLEPELVAALCARLPADCRVVRATGWSDLVEGLRAGRYDLGIGRLSHRTVEAAGLQPSAPWLPLVARFVVLAHTPTVDPMSDPAVLIGVERGTPHALWLEARLPLDRLRRFADAEEMALSLRNGTVGAVFGDGLILWRDLLRVPPAGTVATAGPAVDVEGDTLVLALPQGSRHAAAIDGTIGELVDDGAVADLVARHLPGLTQP